jgi:hypothetical protein
MAAKSPRKSQNTRSKAATENRDQGPNSRSIALGTLSLGAVAGVLAAGVFGLLKLGKGRYVDGQPLTPPPLPGAAPTPADGPTAAKSTAAPVAADTSFGSGEHAPTDLMGVKHPGFADRAVDAFRPDPTASIPEGERDAFRPALAGASAPTLVKGEARENERLDATPS